MTTINMSSNDNLLRNALRGNGIFSTMSGILFTVAAGAVADFMGVDNITIFVVMGIGLLGWALMLFRVTSKSPINKTVGWLVLELDLLWVVGSVVVLVTDAFGLTTEGRWALLIVGDIVLLFAIVEYVGLRRMR